ncbi:optic atrophy 3-like protein [Entophlyctis helioformis]|nr:optic atrophy 3-like protein [Entophlyctis helioformis]
MATTVKLGSLLIKTLSKPLANTIKARAKTNPKFKDFCIGVAQMYHRVDMGLKMRFLDYKIVEPIRPLNDIRAVELGSDFMSESIIFTVTALTIVGETWRTSRNSKNKSMALDDAVERLQSETSANEARIAQLSEALEAAQKELAFPQ